MAYSGVWFNTGCYWMVRYFTIRDKNLPDNFSFDDGEAYLTIKWQPIETAPKDGTEIIVGHDKEKWVLPVFWHHRGWQASGGAVNKPTHWQPFPTPPDAAEIIGSGRDRVAARDLAEWCAREVEASHRDGYLEPAPFIQNADLIVAALREYAVGRNTPDAHGT